jgi:ribosomal protein S18 acetylase RimI-like enzyme
MDPPTMHLRGCLAHALPGEQEKNVTISAMTMNDYEGVYSLWVNTPGMGLNNLDDSREGIEKYLKRNPSTCFVAREEERIIGVILCGHDGRRGFIHHTAVALDERNKGTGRELVRRALEALRAEGIHKVALVVFGRNEIGNAFWEKLGFGERGDLVYRNKVISEKEMVRIDT